jgi:UDPglucose 6-dehydrogenase
MKITVIGTGYVGLVVGLGLATIGDNDVICLDTDLNRIELLNQKKTPIYEMGIDELLNNAVDNQKIRFMSDVATAIEFAEIIFISVGTPQSADGEADLSFIYKAAKDIGENINAYKVIVDKSTVPVGTGEIVKSIIYKEIIKRGKEITFDIVSNPEFLREGTAINDFMKPERIILGGENVRATELLVELYKPFIQFNIPVVITNLETSEIIKYATNAYLATKIAFINQMANLCEKVGANIIDVSKALGMDSRISPKFLNPGPGYGGSCFPKDTRAIASTGRFYGAPLTIIESVINANEEQKVISAAKIINKFPDGGNIAILGLAFKANTDDIRESPALDIIGILLSKLKYKIALFDPIAKFPMDLDSFNYKLINIAGDPYTACIDADAVVILTDWKEFKDIDMNEIIKKMKTPIIFDLRNIYDRKTLESLGYEYFGAGC